MADCTEILFTSDSNASQYTSCVWDPRTGSSLMTYKGGGASNLHGLHLIQDQFIVSANSTKPLIHIWPINSQEQIGGTRYVTPGIVSALAISPDGNFIVAGIKESIYIWQISSGKMLNVLSKHFQTVTSIKFTDDGSHFISAGQDGCILVWNLTKVIGYTDNNGCEPLYIFNDHALPVTDLHVGSGGMRGIICSVSVDRTCKIYNLSNGNLLLNLVLSDPLTSITSNLLETRIYIGSSNGPIFEVNIQSSPRTKDYHFTDADHENKFLGHKGKAVTCLSLSLDGRILASGGQDENVYLWDISSKQLMRTLPHKGSISNIFFNLCSRNMFNPEIKHNLISTNLKRMMNAGFNCSDNNSIVEILVKETSDEYNSDEDNYVEISNFSDSKTERNETERLRKVNRSLYQFCVEQIMKK